MSPGFFSCITNITGGRLFFAIPFWWEQMENYNAYGNAGCPHWLEPSIVKAEEASCMRWMPIPFLMAVITSIMRHPLGLIAGWWFSHVTKYSSPQGNNGNIKLITLMSLCMMKPSEEAEGTKCSKSFHMWVGLVHDKQSHWLLTLPGLLVEG